MLITYTAPNRAHHYIYAAALARSGHLRRFVSGVSRFNPRASLPDVGNKLLRADHVQNFYLASFKFRGPSVVSEELTHWSKIWLDRCSKKDALGSDAFLFYSGAGLGTLKALKSTGTIGVVEAVNSHILVQEKIMREEYERLGLPVKGFHRREIARRVQEFELADGVICPSTFARQSFLDLGMDPSRIRTVPFGVDSLLERDPSERPRDVFRVLFVGQIHLRKGLRYLFEAFKKFKHPKKELWIVGPRTEQTGIDDLTPPPETKFLGVLKGEALSNAYRSCHVFVLPTIEEGMALVIGEALSHGLPVIATVNSGAADLFDDGAAGFLVPIRAPEAIAGKLRLLADNRDTLERMAAAAQSREGRIRSWSDTGRHLVETLADLKRSAKL